MECLKLRKFLFIAVLLSCCVSVRLSAQSLLVEREAILELQSLNNSLNSQLLDIMNSLVLQDLELSKWVDLAKEQQKTINKLSQGLKDQEKSLEQISKEYESQLTLQEELNLSIKKSCQAKQIKTGFIVGGVCIVVGFSIGGIIVYQLMK